MDKEDMALVMTILSLLGKSAVPSEVEREYRTAWQQVQRYHESRNTPKDPRGD